MEKKPLNFFIPFILIVVFISFGDKFLPSPLNKASLQTRTALNNFVIGLFPNKKFRDPNKEHREQADEFERQAQ